MLTWLQLLVELIGEAVRAGIHLGLRRAGEDVRAAREALLNDTNISKDLRDVLGQFPPALPAPADPPNAATTGPLAPVEPDGEKPPKRGPGRPSKEELARRAAQEALAQAQGGGQQP